MKDLLGPGIFPAWLKFTITLMSVDLAALRFRTMECGHALAIILYYFEDSHHFCHNFYTFPPQTKHVVLGDFIQ